MPTDEDYDRSTPLQIYLAYDYLPTSQYARMLSALDSLYEALVTETSEDDDFYFFYFYKHRRVRSWPHGPWLPMCIDSVETGQSITIRFAARGESSRVAWRERDLDILLPRATAPLCAMGVLLTGGAWSYERYLVSEKTKAETRQIEAQADVARAQFRLTEAQADLTKAQTAEILSKHREPPQPPKPQPNRGKHFEVQAQIQSFYSLASQPNISSVKVNDVNIRDLRE
jgi:hypothetical protein